MNVTINGEAREVPEGLSVAGLLAHLGLAPERVARSEERRVGKECRL